MALRGGLKCWIRDRSSPEAVGWRCLCGATRVLAFGHSEAFRQGIEERADRGHHPAPRWEHSVHCSFGNERLPRLEDNLRVVRLSRRTPSSLCTDAATQFRCLHAQRLRSGPTWVACMIGSFGELSAYRLRVALFLRALIAIPT